MCLCRLPCCGVGVPYLRQGPQVRCAWLPGYDPVLQRVSLSLLLLCQLTQGERNVGELEAILRACAALRTREEDDDGRA